MNSGNQSGKTAKTLVLVTCAALGIGLFASRKAAAHDHSGPPLKIISQKQVGPWTISAWIHAQAGTSTVFVAVNSASGNAPEKDLKVDIGVQPDNLGSRESFYSARCDTCEDGQYRTDVPLGTDNAWQIRIRLTDSQGVHETTTSVEPSQPGPSAWQLPLYLLPFVSVGGLWLRVGILRRGMKRKQATVQQFSNDAFAHKKATKTS